MKDKIKPMHIICFIASAMTLSNMNYRNLSILDIIVICILIIAIISIIFNIVKGDSQ